MHILYLTPVLFNPNSKVFHIVDCCQGSRIQDAFARSSAKHTIQNWMTQLNSVKGTTRVTLCESKGNLIFFGHQYLSKINHYMIEFTSISSTNLMVFSLITCDTKKKWDPSINQSSIDILCMKIFASIWYNKST
jgi:hypothetical protein